MRKALAHRVAPQLRVGRDDVVGETGAGQDREEDPLTGGEAGMVEQHRGAVLANTGAEDRDKRPQN